MFGGVENYDSVGQVKLCNSIYEKQYNRGLSMEYANDWCYPPLKFNLINYYIYNYSALRKKFVFAILPSSKPRALNVFVKGQ